MLGASRARADTFAGSVVASGTITFFPPVSANGAVGFASSPADAADADFSRSLSTSSIQASRPLAYGWPSTNTATSITTGRFIANTTNRNQGFARSTSIGICQSPSGVRA